MNLGVPYAVGNTAEIYLFEGKIVKVFNDDFPETESLYEANKQRLAYSLGLNVPKVLDVREIDGRQTIIMEYIKGRTIGDILFEDMDQAEHYMNMSIDIQQEIHKVAADTLNPMNEKLKRQIESTHNLDEQYKSHLLEKLEAMTYEKKLCHGDFHLFNLIVSDNGQVTIIDWVDSSAGDIRADVYRTYLLYLQFSVELAEMYLRLYLQKSDLSKEEIFQWAPIIAGARLSENIASDNAKCLMDIVKFYCPL